MILRFEGLQIGNRLRHVALALQEFRREAQSPGLENIRSDGLAAKGAGLLRERRGARRPVEQEGIGEAGAIAGHDIIDHFVAKLLAELGRAIEARLGFAVELCIRRRRRRVSDFQAP